MIVPVRSSAKGSSTTLIDWAGTMSMIGVNLSVWVIVTFASSSPGFSITTANLSAMLVKGCVRVRA